MANEVTKVELFGFNGDGQGVRYTVNTGSYYTKGTIMTLVSGTTRTMHETTDGTGSLAVAGILAMDVSGANAATVLTDGIFEFTVSGTVAVGDNVMSCGSRNLIMAANLGSAIDHAPYEFGYVLKAATDLTRTSVRVHL